MQCLGKGVEGLEVSIYQCPEALAQIDSSELTVRSGNLSVSGRQRWIARGGSWRGPWEATASVW